MFYPERLSWIRKKRGLTKSTLAKLVEVDLRAISAFEAGEYPPSQSTELLLVQKLQVKKDFFHKGELAGLDSDQVSFRSFSRLAASKRDMALGSAVIAFALCEWIGRKFELPVPSVPDLRAENSPEGAAHALRYIWGLGEKPISNMIHLLESKGVRVFSLALDIADVDACCTWYNSEPFIFLNTKKSHARRRFDAAHELAHLVLHRHGGFTNRDLEKEADEFASAFLMPRNGFSSTAPRLADLKSIIPAKVSWGVSVAAYVYRLHVLGLLSDWHYRTLFQQLSQRGYRTKEPMDSKPELSKLAELVLVEIRKDGLGLKDISDDLGIKEHDIAELLFDLAIFGIDGSAISTTRSALKKPNLRLAVDNV